ncbi:MAG: VCBS repeat-containing protein, partial [Chloroflexi bacterium]|nr:VCBS repeat-containing protein [Chloroflexota bacterium]
FAWTTKAQESTPPFKDVTDVSGINSPRQEGGEKVTGQAWGDYDQDGWPDLYLTDTDGVNTLYHNNGDGTFSVSGLTHQVALPDSLSGGAVFADYNNDGWPDLYVMNWGANKLYRNIAGNGFFDITEKAGVGDESNGKTASWGDYDQDGLLDLYLANWSCTPKCGRSFEGDKDRL